MKKIVLILAAFILMFAAPVYATGGHNTPDPDTTIEVEQDQNQRQGQGQEQDQYQGQQQGQGQGQGQEQEANNEGVSLTNTSTSTYKRPANTHLSSGTSTANDQKVRSVSGGWLTGGVGLRWDATDKELRKLRRADILRDRGQVSAADKLECSTKVIYKAIGGNPDDCYTELAGSNTDVDRTSYNRNYERQLEDMQRQINILEEQTADCSETANRVLQKCASK